MNLLYNHPHQREFQTFLRDDYIEKINLLAIYVLNNEAAFEAASYFNLIPFYQLHYFPLITFNQYCKVNTWCKIFTDFNKIATMDVFFHLH